MRPFRYSVSIKTNYENDFEYVQLCTSLRQVFKFIKINSKIDDYTFVITPLFEKEIVFTPDF